MGQNGLEAVEDKRLGSPQRTGNRAGKNRLLILYTFQVWGPYVGLSFDFIRALRTVP
jgi:hypothetical protein